MDEKLKLRLEKVESLFNNKLIVKNNFEPIDISNGINWSYKHKHNESTYQIYLHSLIIIKELTICYQKLGDEKYVIKAKDLIMDWYNNNSSINTKNKAWHEHSVSSRIGNIIYFNQRAKSFSLEPEIFQKIIKSHSDYLNNEKYYKHNNHGLMMDNALLMTSNFIDDKMDRQNKIDKALYRVRFAIFRDFSRKGIHLENSPEYHRMVLNIIGNIEKTLKNMRLSLGSSVNGLLNKAKNYDSYIMKPDFTYPLLGDTGQIEDVKINKKYIDLIDYESGNVILQNKNSEDLYKSTWLHFKAGYQSKTHKHADDLSLNLYLEGNDLLIDSGKYSYKISDPMREYITSPGAHNTIYLKDRNYKLSNAFDDQSRMRISKVIQKKNYKQITGMNKLYPGIILTRNIILTKYNHVIVVDRTMSKNVETYIQNFNFNENAVVEKIDDLNFKIALNNEEYTLKTVKLDKHEFESQISKGAISRKFTKLIENKKIEIVKKAKVTNFITQIQNDNNNMEINDIRISEGYLKFNIENEIFEIDL